MLKNLKKAAAIVLSFAMAVQFGLADSYYVNAVEEPVEPQQEETTTTAPQEQEQEEVPTTEEETPQQQEEGQQQPAVEEEQPAAEEAQPLQLSLFLSLVPFSLQKVCTAAPVLPSLPLLPLWLDSGRNQPWLRCPDSPPAGQIERSTVSKNMCYVQFAP